MFQTEGTDNAKALRKSMACYRSEWDGDPGGHVKDFSFYSEIGSL